MGGGDRGDANPGNNLHVSGLSTRVEDRDLEEIFSKFGRVRPIAQVIAH
jgi:RNA recognition motif-containing protein